MAKVDLITCMNYARLDDPWVREHFELMQPKVNYEDKHYATKEISQRLQSHGILTMYEALEPRFGADMAYMILDYLSERHEVVHIALCTSRLLCAQKIHVVHGRYRRKELRSLTGDTGDWDATVYACLKISRFWPGRGLADIMEEDDWRARCLRDMLDYKQSISVTYSSP